MLLRGLILHVAEQKSIKNLMINSPLVRRMARRFVAGETLEEVLAAARAMQDAGFTASLDHLGENVSSEAEADAARDVYLRLLDDIHARSLNANVSVKLTQMGLDLSMDRCYEHVVAVVQRANERGNFVRVDMEASPYTERTLQVVSCLRKRFSNVGAVIQSYLYRSEKDVEELLAEGTRIRLCKGAYQEPPEVAYPHKSEVDANYVRIMKVLLTSGIYHGIATHDPHIIAATKEFARAEKIAPDAFEFQMLYGIRRDLQAQLLKEGYRLRVYIPYGSHWFPYLTRRLAERPANLMFFVRNLFRG